MLAYKWKFGPGLQCCLGRNERRHTQKHLSHSFLVGCLKEILSQHLEHQYVLWKGEEEEEVRKSHRYLLMFNKQQTRFIHTQGRLFSVTTNEASFLFFSQSSPSTCPPSSPLIVVCCLLASVWEILLPPSQGSSVSLSLKPMEER